MSTIIGYVMVGVVTIIMALATWVIVFKANKDINNDKEAK